VSRESAFAQLAGCARGSLSWSVGLVKIPPVLGAARPGLCSRDLVEESCLSLRSAPVAVHAAKRARLGPSSGMRIVRSP